MSTDLVFQNTQNFKAYCKKHPSRTLVIHKNIVYDVTEFVDAHPGGKDIIFDFQSEDITIPFRSEEYHEHSDNAYRMLAKYKVGYIKESHQQEKQKDEGESYPLITKEKIQYKDFSIDLTVGMAAQVKSLNKTQYLHMIHNPIHLPYCKLFDDGLRETLSRNNWYSILITWYPVGLYLLYLGMTCNYTDSSAFDKLLFNGSPDFSVLAVILTYLFGVFLWTFGEYTFHRTIFHLDEHLPDNKHALYIHFLIHGIHHTIPMDPERLVLPPVLGVIAYMLVFPLLVAIFPGNLGRIVSSGFVMAYATYDVTHLFLHHGNPWLGHLKEMKKYHLKHHYVDGTRGYGITTKIWDKVFRTELM